MNTTTDDTSPTSLSAKRLVLPFVLAIIAFIATGVLNYQAVNTLLANQRAQVAQRLVAIELQNLVALAMKAETGQRGFVITGQDQYLQPYLEAVRGVPASIGVLRRNLANDREQMIRIETVERIQNMKFAELEESIAARRQGGFEAAQAIVITNRGKQYMDALLAEVAAMDKVESAKLQQRIRQSTGSGEQAFRTIVVAGILDVGLLLGLFYAVRADARTRQAAAQRIADARTLLRDALDGSPALIYLRDRSGRFILANRALEQYFGVAPGALDNRDAAEILPQALLAEETRRDREVLESGRLLQFEQELPGAAGSRHFVAYKAPLRDHQGQLRGVCGVLVDVTPLKQAEAEIRLLNQTLEQRVVERTEELDRVNQELRDANIQLEAFSYTVAHDLRAPLRSVHGFTEAVLEDYAPLLDAAGQDYLRRIHRAAIRMEGLIDDLLGFSRLSQMEFRLEIVWPDEVLAEVRANLAAAVAEKGARLEVQAGMPPVRANHTVLAQVLQNLVANAIKFNRPQQQPLVRVQAQRRDGMVRIWVEDEGIGIAADHQERIFRPFERLHGVDEFPGSGIGLAIVDKAVRRMHGYCGVESVVNQGSRFWIELPAALTENP